MDLFNNLSPEVRLLIYLSLGSFEEVVTLSHASPVMYQQRHASCRSINQHFIECGRGGWVVQDAMAVALFPREIAQEERTLTIEAHLRKWGAMGFSVEFQGADTDTLCQLRALYKRMWQYIEDYLSKATSPHLPRAYRRLPTWSHEHFARSFTQIRLAREDCCFGRKDLTPAEQRRILQAFLRYELLCKVYSPTGGPLCATPRLHRDSYGVEVDDIYNGYEFDAKDPFLHWDWCLLYKYEGKKIDLNEPPPELLLLPCVREYVLTVYGALIADQVRAALPQSGENPNFVNAPARGGRGFPDYDELSGWEDLHRLGGTGWSKPVISLLASAGFDLLTATLTSSGSEFRKFIYGFTKETIRSSPFKEATNVFIPPSGPSRRRRIKWHCNDFIRLHRQRAWILFIIRGGPPIELPTVSRYSEIYGERPPGSLVGWDLEDDDTRNEWICYGGTYPSLVGRVVPFWSEGGQFK